MDYGKRSLPAPRFLIIIFSSHLFPFVEKVRTAQHPESNMKVLQPFSNPSLWFSCRSCSKTDTLSKYEEDEESSTSDSCDDISVSVYGGGHVHFCLAQNEFHESEHCIEDADHAMELWYSENDFLKFHEDAIACATQSCAKEMICQAYTKCQTVPTKQDLDDLWSWQSRIDPTSLPASSVGLEKWISADMRQNRSLQRRKQYGYVQRIQSSSSLSFFHTVHTEHELRRACIRVSQSGRLFAVYLGRMVHQQREKYDSD